MTVQNLSPNAEDYLKMIWDLLEWGHDSVQPSVLANKAGVKPSTVSGAVSRLVAGGYALHNPYGNIELTEQGERYAVQMVRKHRLLEMFLVTVLGYRWDEVHTEADSLEHAASDTMIERIDDLLGHPAADPHGDPIPRRDGSLPENTNIALSDVPDDSLARVERVSDDDPALLRYLDEHGIGLHSTITVSTNTQRPAQVDAQHVTDQRLTISVVPDEGSDAGAQAELTTEAGKRIRVTLVRQSRKPKTPERRGTKKI